MTLLKIQRMLVSLAAASVAALFCSLTWVLWHTPILLHADGVLTRTEGVLSKTNATLINLDKATKTWADASNDQAGQVDGLVKQARGTLSSASGALTETSQRLQGTIDATTSLVASAQAATAAVPPLLGDVRTAVQGIGPVEDSATAALKHLDATEGTVNDLLKRKAVEDLLDNVAGMTKSGNHMLLTADAVETKLTYPYLHPSRNPFVRTWNQVQPFAAAGAKVVAATF